CPNGCCDVTQTCQSGSSSTACGAAGLLCASCPDSQPCSEGVCAGCASTCTTGCCAGSTCEPVAGLTCGLVGKACTACDATLAPDCSTMGACSCGGGPACVGGQRCLNGLCVCDATSCSEGCCQGTTCEMLSPAACGPVGESCAVCATG